MAKTLPFCESFLLRKKFEAFLYPEKLLNPQFEFKIKMDDLEYSIIFPKSIDQEKPFLKIKL